MRLFIAFNASSIEQNVEIVPAHEGSWHCVVNTSKLPPNDIFKLNEGPRVLSHSIKMAPYSSLVLLRRSKTYADRI
jgi:pullulanase/glycogen debranching enzyme